MSRFIDLRAPIDLPETEVNKLKTHADIMVEPLVSYLEPTVPAAACQRGASIGGCWLCLFI